MCASLKSGVSQQGTVLIMAILIVAVVAGLSIKFASDYQLGLARAESRWHGLQARAYIQGAETLAMHWLKEDDPAVDYAGEGWDAPMSFPIEGGYIAGVLLDASALLNLNSLNTPLAADKPANAHDRYSEHQRRFLRLLQTMPEPMPQEQAVALLEALVDWMDVDDEESGFGGAESYFYQNQEMPYQAANGPFMSLDELRLVRYMTPELMAWLRQHVTVLPSNASMNVNSLSLTLLRTLNATDRLEPLSEADARQLVESLPESGFYSSLEDLSSNWNLSVGGGNLDTSGLAVATFYFWLRAEVSLVDQRLIQRSLIQRDGETSRVLLRLDDYQ